MSKSKEINQNLTLTPRVTVCSESNYSFQPGQTRKGKFYNYLTSLQNLQSLKRNPKTHSLPYSELNQFRTSTSPGIDASSIKNAYVKKHKPSLNEEYMSLDPAFLKDKMPPKQKKVHLPSEKRQLYMDQFYQTQTTKTAATSPKNLESIWHQTLSTKSVTENMMTSFDKDHYKPSLDMGSLDSSTPRTFYFPRGSHPVLRVHTEEAPSEGLRSGQVIMTEPSEEKRTVNPDELNLKQKYLTLQKEVKVIEDIQKDFTKLVFHAQKSYLKAEQHQVGLHNFATMFATEIAQLEKFPKESKVSKLTSCVQTIYQKTDELHEEEELLRDQIAYINGLLLQAPPQSPRSTVSAKPFILSPGGSNLAKSHIIETPNTTDRVLTSPSTKAKKVIIHSPERTESEGLDDRSYTARESITNAQNKTQELKSEVKKLQEERTEFIISMRTPSSAKVKVVKNQHSKKWDITSSSKNEIEEEEYQLYNGLTVKPGALTDRAPRKSQDISVATKVVTFVNRLKEKMADHGEEAKPWDSAMDYYVAFRRLLDHLETSLQQKTEKMKVLKKDVDEDRDNDDTNKEIIEEIKSLYQEVVEQIQRSIHSFSGLKFQFLREVAKHYTSLQNLNKSNLLKIESLKNMVEDSIQKVVEIANFSKKYTYRDLEDKTVRQKYNTKYDEMKGELMENHKTLLFLADQFNFQISVYQLCPISQITHQNLNELRTQFETISKVLFYLQTMPELEEEYNEKTGKAYKAVKAAAVVQESIQEAYEDEEVGRAKKLREGEEPMNALKSMSVKIASLRNKLEVMSKVKILKNLVEKPLLVTLKLAKRIEMNEKSLEQSLRNVQEKVTVDYNDLVSQCVEIENHVNTHTNRLLTTKEHLGFTNWSQNAKIMEALRYDIDALDLKILRCMKEDYPARVALLPKPQQKREGLEVLRKAVEAVIKTLTMGHLFTKENFYSCFEEVKSSNLKEKLENVFQHVEKEIEEKENIIRELEAETTPARTLVAEALQFLTHLRSILKKTFDLQNRLGQEYLSFQGERLDEDPYFQNTTQILDNNRECLPQLLTKANLDNQQGQGAMSTGLVQSIIIEDPSESGGPSPTSPKKLLRHSTTLPNIQNPEQSLSKIDLFIGKLKRTFKEFIEEQIGAHKNEHIVFKGIYDRFHEMSKKEVDGMERVRSAINSAQVNQIFFNKEVRPLTKIYKCIDTLPMWDEKMESLLIVKHNMNDTLTMLKSFEGDQNIRGGVESQLTRYQYTQKIVTVSMDILTEVLSLGRIFTPKDLKAHLGHQLRVDGVALEAFIKLVERKVDKIMEVFNTNKNYIELDTAALTEKVAQFIKILVALLRATQRIYAQLMKKLIEGTKRFEEDFVKFLDDLYATIKGLTDMFVDNVNRLARMTIKPTWVVKLLDEFYKETILKDLQFFGNLWNNAKEVGDFLKDFKENFLEIEIIQKTQYRKVADSNPTRCDWKVTKASELLTTLNFLAHSEELMSRPQLKQLLLTKHKSLSMVKKVYSNFALIYSMGRKLSDKVDDVLMNKKDVMVILQKIPEVEAMLQDMIRHLDKLGMESKTVVKNCDIGSDYNLSAVIKDEILQFYIDLSAWFSRLKSNLSKNVQFYADLKRNFKGQVCLMRHDWMSFIKDWLTNSATDLLKDTNKIHNNYHDFKERIDGFIKEIQKNLQGRQSTLKEILASVEHLNENFFMDWFFDFSEDKHFNDKILMKISKTLEKLRGDDIALDFIQKKVRKLVDTIEKCDICIRFLASEEEKPTVFEGGIKNWDHVVNYYRVRNIRAWLNILQYVEARMLLQQNNVQGKAEFKEKVQTVEGLYLRVEQTTKCYLNSGQREFLTVIYQWMNKTLFANE